MGNSMCISLDPDILEPTIRKLPRRDSAILKCACCDGEFLTSDSKNCCQGGCQIIHNLTNEGIKFDAATEKWHVKDGNSYEWSDDARASNRASKKRPKKRPTGPRFSYSGKLFCLSFKLLSVVYQVLSFSF